MSNRPSVKRLTVLISIISLIFYGQIFAAEKRADPMKPPAFALLKFQQAKNKLKASKTPARAKSPTQKISAPKTLLKLTSVLISSDRRVAIINDQMLVVGDKIGKAKLIKIEKDSVNLIRDGKKVLLRLNDTLTAVRKISGEKKL